MTIHIFIEDAHRVVWAAYVLVLVFVFRKC